MWRNMWTLCSELLWIKLFRVELHIWIWQLQTNDRTHKWKSWSPKLWWGNVVNRPWSGFQICFERGGMGLSLHPGFRKVKLSHNFVVIAICICPNFKMYLSKLHKCICLNCRQDVICVCQNFKYFCPNCQIYLFNLKIWTNSNLNFKMYLHKLQNVFV